VSIIQLPLKAFPGIAGLA